MRYHSASHIALNDFLKDSGRVASCFSVSNTGGFAVGVGERLAERSLGQTCDLDSMFLDGVGVEISPHALTQRLVQTQYLEG